jgi:hypothetical protein
MYRLGTMSISARKPILTSCNRISYTLSLYDETELSHMGEYNRRHKIRRFRYYELGSLVGLFIPVAIPIRLHTLQNANSCIVNRR